MAKRQKISYNGDALAENLKQSNAKGVDAFFPEQPVAQVSSQTVALPEPSSDADVRARTDARMHARNQSPTQASGDTETGAQTDTRMQPEDRPEAEESKNVDLGAIRRRVSAKRHLTSYTFRFRANELEELDLVFDELNQDDEHRTSKNDAVRTAVNWLLADYKLRKEKSVQARVLLET